MKLLLDQNLSYRLVEQLQDLFPDSSHVRFMGLDKADDSTIWERARRENFAIVSFDYDFYERSLLAGFPPKIVWLRCGNTSTQNILKILRAHHKKLIAFESDKEVGCLELA